MEGRGDGGEEEMGGGERRRGRGRSMRVRWAADGWAVFGLFFFWARGTQWTRDVKIWIELVNRDGMRDWKDHGDFASSFLLYDRRRVRVRRVGIRSTREIGHEAKLEVIIHDSQAL